MNKTMFLILLFASLCCSQQNGIRYEFKTDKKVYLRNETVKFEMCVTNKTMKTVRFPCSFRSTSLKIDKDIDNYEGVEAASDFGHQASLKPQNDSAYYKDLEPNDSVCINFKSYAIDFPKNKSGRCIFSGYVIPVKMARTSNDSIALIPDRIPFDSLEVIIDK